jgi:RNA polymerase sigma factor (sigma-70 family)
MHLILLRTISPYYDTAAVFRAARMACSIEVATNADFFYSGQVSNGRLEGETPHAMTPEQFHRAYQKLAADTSPLVKYASRWGPEEAKDVVQDVMQRLWRLRLDAKKIEEIDNLIPYAKQAVRNAAVDAIRRKRSKHVDATQLDVENEIHQSMEQFGRPKDPQELADEEQRQELLLDAVSRLPPLDRDVITGHRLQGESAETTANRLNITVHQVRGIAERALVKLYGLIEKQRRKGDKHGH